MAAFSLLSLKQNSRQPSVEMSSKAWEEAEAEQAVVDREDLQEVLRQDRGKTEQQENGGRHGQENG